MFQRDNLSKDHLYLSNIIINMEGIFSKNEGDFEFKTEFENIISAKNSPAVLLIRYGAAGT